MVDLVVVYEVSQDLVQNVVTWLAFRKIQRDSNQSVFRTAFYTRKEDPKNFGQASEICGLCTIYRGRDRVIIQPTHNRHFVVTGEHRGALKYCLMHICLVRKTLLVACLSSVYGQILQPRTSCIILYYIKSFVLHI